MNALNSYYDVFVAIHVAFMVTWFAGLFYLPRLFIYPAQASDTISRERFSTMERRLFAIMTLGAILTAIFGLILVGVRPFLMDFRWFQVKLALVIVLLGYHYRCYLWILRLSDADAVADTKWLRWFNEIPVFFLFAIIILVVTKAF